MDNVSSGKRIREPGTAAKEIIIILKEMSKYIDITTMPSDSIISDLLTPGQIRNIKNKTGLEFDDDMRIKLAVNNLKFGGLTTNDKQRQALKELGLMSDENIKKLEGKIFRKKIEKKNKNVVKRDNVEKAKKEPRISAISRTMRILFALEEMRINVTNIRQADTLKRYIDEKNLIVLKEKSEIEDVRLDFRIGMYIDNIRQGKVKTNGAQREILKDMGILSKEHISKLEKRDKLAAELKNVLSEIKAIDIEEEEIKNELAKIIAREKELKEKLKDVEVRKDNAQKNLKELNSKGIENKSR